MTDFAIRHVLVPLDGSGTAEWALPLALLVAREADAEVHLFRCLTSLTRAFPDITAAGYLREWEARQHSAESEYLGALAGQLRRDGFTASAETAEGDPVRTVVDASAKADLVVMTAHGWSGPERAWLGHVSDGVVHHTRTPVIIVRAESREPPAPLAPIEAGIRRILVATDGSEAARSGERHALALARLLGSRVTLFRGVRTPLGPSSPYIPHAAALDRDVATQREAEALAYLEERSRKALDVEVDVRISQTANVARDILTAAVETGADLVAVGTHRESRLARVVLGSVADKVVRGTRVPVLVAHAD